MGTNNFDVVSFFAGAGGLDTGFHNAGFNIRWANEFDKKVTPTLKKNFPETIVDDRSLFDVPLTDIPDNITGVVGGPPCFPKGHFVLTRKGYKDISEIVVGDKVLTHTGRYREVFDYGFKKAPILEIKIFGSIKIKTTKNHPFYCVETFEITKNGEPYSKVSKPHWLPAHKLTSRHYILSPLDEIREASRHNLTDQEAYLIGWRAGAQRYNTIEREPVSTDTSQLYTILDGFNGTEQDAFPQWIFREPLHLQEKILEGFVDGNGQHHLTEVTSPSLKIALGIQRIVRNVTKNEGILKEIKIDDILHYQVIWGKSKTNKFYVDDFYVCSQVKSVTETEKEKKVYNFSVKEDESYTINNFAVHNCQSWSLGGLGKGLDDRRGQVFLEYIKVIENKQPLFFLAENVKGMLAKTRKQDLDTILKAFDSLGYNLTYGLVNAADYGVPQDRWRVFFVGYHKSLGKEFVFPEPLDSKITLRDTILDLRETSVAGLGNRGNGANSNLMLPNHEFATGTFSSQFMSRNRTRSWDDQSFTIQASGRHAPLHPDSGLMVKVGKDLYAFADEDKIRRLTIREAARIQTFPDNHEFIYSQLETGYKMVGNAVPVKLAEVFASKIMQDLTNF